MIKHISTSPTHYDKEAKHYDAFNEALSVQINQLIEQILQESNVKTVLDLTCGTGSQVFWLADQGFDVFGIDINETMISIARQKANEKGLPLHFELGDMRNSKVG